MLRFFGIKRLHTPSLTIRTDLEHNFDFVPVPRHPVSYKVFEEGLVAYHIDHDAEFTRIQRHSEHGDPLAKQSLRSPFDMYTDAGFGALCLAVCLPSSRVFVVEAMLKERVRRRKRRMERYHC